MLIGIYDPYLDTLGGGERYMLSFAESLSASHGVRVFWDDAEILEKASDRLGLSLSGVKIVPDIWKKGIISKLRESSKYDVIIYLSDGSLPWSLSKNMIVHFQFPVPWVNGADLITQMKLKRTHSVIVNSVFVKQHIDKTFGIDSTVIYPGVDTHSFKPGKKSKTILTVGRFTQGMNTKNHDTLIEAFRSIHEADSEWKLVIAGGVRDEDVHEVKRLEQMAGDLPISLKPNISFAALKKMYAQSAIYWHAAGYLKDLIHKPHAAEHFGITIVESMAAGCVPIVFDGGGVGEIVRHNKDGFVWNTTTELLEYTQTLIHKKSQREKMSKSSIERSRMFDKRQSEKKLHSVLAI